MLTDFALPAMLVLVPALLASAAAAALAPARARVATLAVTAVGALLAAIYVVGGLVPGDVTLPLGLPLAGATFGLDALSGFFLLPVLLAGVAAALFALQRVGRDAVTLPVLLAGLVLTLLAGDGFVLLLGLGLVAAAGWDAGERVLLAVLGVACLVGVIGLLAPVPGGTLDPRFVAAHAMVGGSWRGGAALALLAIGTMLLPLRAFLPSSGHGSALLQAMVPVVTLYLLARVLFNLAGPLPPAWWGSVILAAGAACSVAGGARAVAAAEVSPVIAAAGLVPFGLAVTAIGLAVIAHAADLPPLASLALGAALLESVVLALVQTLLLLGAAAVEDGAGTRRLDRLGGLAQSMRSTSACMVVGAAVLAALPPAAGFGGAWLAFQALFGSLRIGGMPLLLLLAAVAAAMALALGLVLAAMLRLLGIAFLGRPRSPRGAAAEDAPGPAVLAMAGLAGLLLVLGLLPGPVLALAAPVLHALVGAQADGRNSALALVPQAGQMPYSAVAVTLLLVVLLLLVAWAGRRWTVPGERRAPVWEDGFAAPPAWLPFGDPATEISPDAFAAPLPGCSRLPVGASRAVRRLRRLAGWLAGSLPGRLAALDREVAPMFALALLAVLLLLAWAAGA